VIDDRCVPAGPASYDRSTAGAGARNVLLTQTLETRPTLDLPPTHRRLATEYHRLRGILTARTTSGGIDV
jgi:hypothetical protein